MRNILYYLLMATCILLVVQAKSQCDTATIYADTSHNQVCFDTLDNVLKCYSNNYPDHDDSYNSPFNVKASEQEFSMCFYPDTAEHFTPLYEEVETTAGCTYTYTFGVSINGVKYDPSSAEFFEDTSGANNIEWHVEARYLFNGSFGNNGGHLNPFGEYHYHDIPVDYFIDSLGINGSEHSPIVGYAADGFPIYYKYTYASALDTSSSIVGLTSGYSLKSGTRPGDGISAPNGSYTGLYYEDYEYSLDTLDSCNGRYGITPEYPNGTYYYVLTDNYPYIPRCFKGDAVDNSYRVGPGAACPASTASTSCDTAANNVVYGCTDPFSCNYNASATISDGSCYYAVMLDTTVATACNHFFWHGMNFNSTGIYLDTVNNSTSCDSIATLILTIKNTTTASVSVSACGSYTWIGTSYSSTGTYHDTISNSVGCDSLMTLHLTITDTIQTFDTLVGCDSAMFNGIVYNSTGSYVIDTVSSSGCDSISNVEVSINLSSEHSQYVTACESYSWNGSTYTSSGVYSVDSTNMDGCDSTSTLYLTILSIATDSQSVTACGSYTWNSNVYTTSGVYTHTSTGANGCDSVSTLSLTLGTVSNVSLTASSCDSYTWNGSTYQTSGTYYDTSQTTLGCDSITTLTLTILDSSSSTSNLTACDSLVWNGSTYFNSGQYTFSGTNAAGCDSTAYLNLTINVSSQSEETVVHCGNYSWNGNAYNTSGTYSIQFTNSAGCDSISTLHLTINQPSGSTVNQNACDSIIWIGYTVYESGTYVDTLENASGCDSVVTLNAIIHPSGYSLESVESCGPYFWHGQLLFNSGMYLDTVPGGFGCDSVTQLDLIVNHPTTSHEVVSACDSYNWLGIERTQSGVYHDTIENSAGCDSNMTLDLTLINIDANIQVNGATINAVDSLAESYQWLDCNADFNPISNETNFNFTATENGLYAVEIEEQGCLDTSECVSISGLYVNRATDDITWVLYPNPVDEVLNIKGEITEQTEVSIYTMYGGFILRVNCEKIGCQISTSNLPAAVYLVKIESGSVVRTFRVTKA